MFNGHTMTLICDLNIIGSEINDMDFIIVAAITAKGNYPDHPNIFNAGILMPPTELLMAWSDGNELVLQNEYPAYLNCKDPDEMIVALIALLTKKNVVLYIPKDEFMVYGQFLLAHLQYMYGITCNFMNIQFSINQAKIPFIISKFYMMDLMNPNDYIGMYPANQPLPQFVIYKLATDLHPFNHPATFMEYEVYFNNLNMQKAMQQQHVNMVSMIGDRK